MKSTFFKFLLCLCCVFGFQLARAQDATNNATDSGTATTNGPTIQETVVWLCRNVRQFDCSDKTEYKRNKSIECCSSVSFTFGCEEDFNYGFGLTNDVLIIAENVNRNSTYFYQNDKCITQINDNGREFYTYDFGGVDKSCYYTENNYIQISLSGCNPEVELLPDSGSEMRWNPYSDIKQRIDDFGGDQGNDVIDDSSYVIKIKQTKPGAILNTWSKNTKTYHTHVATGDEISNDTKFNQVEDGDVPAAGTSSIDVLEIRVKNQQYANALRKGLSHIIQLSGGSSDKTDDFLLK